MQLRKNNRRDKQLVKHEAYTTAFFIIAISVTAIIILFGISGCTTKTTVKTTTTNTNLSTVNKSVNLVKKNIVSMQNSKEAHVIIKNNRFSPSTLIISPGTKVVWHNEDNTDHTVTFIDKDSGVIIPGSEYSRVFNNKGEYEYHCQLHPEMNGLVSVS